MPKAKPKRAATRLSKRDIRAAKTSDLIEIWMMNAVIIPKSDRLVFAFGRSSEELAESRDIRAEIDRRLPPRER